MSLFPKYTKLFKCNTAAQLKKIKEVIIIHNMSNINRVALVSSKIYREGKEKNERS